MPIVQSRRHFITSAPAAGAAALIGGIGAATLIGGGRVLADEGPPETTTVRLRFEVAGPTPAPTNGVGVPDNANCDAPLPLARDLLSAEGFTDIRYVQVNSGPPYTQAWARDEIDFGVVFPTGFIRRLEARVPITALAGIHSGCLELFAHQHIRNVVDLKGKQVGLPDPLGGAGQLYVSIMAAHVGLDPSKDIKWVTTDDDPSPIDLFAQGKIDAYLAFVYESRALRARGIGRVLVDMANDKPWSNYFCCLLVGQTDFVQKYPVATKRLLRAILKTNDLCSAEPARVARQLVDRGFAQSYDVARQMLMDIPYASWRALDPEDSLRFYALWMYEFGELHAAPNELITKGTNWRFLDQIRRELKT